MHRTNLLQQLQEYSKSILITEHEKPMLDRLVNFIATNEHCFERSNPGHITTSVWLINAQKTHALLTHHRKFNLWVQLGGHNDGDVDCKAVALKEGEEESGITGLIFAYSGIFDIDIHPIPSACLYHYDIRYLLQAPENSSYQVSEESHDLAWVPFDKVHKYAKQSSVLRMNEKCKNFLQ
jgi:hypothetical protein